jgi:hypothetical protein
MIDPLTSIAAGLIMGRVPEDLFAGWPAAHGDPVSAMWTVSHNPLAMMDLIIGLDIVGVFSPEELEYDLLSQYALEYPAHPRDLMEHAIRLSRSGHAHGHEASRVRDELDEAADDAPGLYWIPIHSARQLIAPEMEHHSVGSEVRALAAMETSDGYPFEQPKVAIRLKMGFAPPTVEDVYAAANRRSGSTRASAQRTRGAEQAVLHNPSRPGKRRRR